MQNLRRIFLGCVLKFEAVVEPFQNEKKKTFSIEVNECC